MTKAALTSTAPSTTTSAISTPTPNPNPNPNPTPNPNPNPILIRSRIRTRSPSRPQLLLQRAVLREQVRELGAVRIARGLCRDRGGDGVQIGRRSVWAALHDFREHRHRGRPFEV